MPLKRWVGDTSSKWRASVNIIQQTILFLDGDVKNIALFSHYCNYVIVLVQRMQLLSLIMSADCRVIALVSVPHCQQCLFFVQCFYGNSHFGISHVATGAMVVFANQYIKTCQTQIGCSLIFNSTGCFIVFLLIGSKLSCFCPIKHPGTRTKKHPRYFYQNLGTYVDFVLLLKIKINCSSNPSPLSPSQNQII